MGAGRSAGETMGSEPTPAAALSRYDRATATFHLRHVPPRWHWPLCFLGELPRAPPCPVPRRPDPLTVSPGSHQQPGPRSA